MKQHYGTFSRVIFHFPTKGFSLLLGLLFGFSLQTSGQDVNIGGVINAYTPVIQIDGTCTNQIEVENISPFAEGDRILLIQMKGAEIDLDNTSSFGDIVDIGSAGLYEFCTVAFIVPLTNTLVLENQILNEYNLDGKVQAVLVPQYENATVVSSLLAQEWDGDTGGVLAFEVEGTLTLEASINCTGQGFRGGEASENFFSPGNCASMNYRFPNNPQRGGEKGEGISIFAENFNTGRGAPVNGGGGGNNLNAGGGGGSNFGQGGLGGNEWTGCTSAAVGGLGGKPLDFSGRLFLGGGGGGGHQNDSQGTAGENGGGIVFIQANNLTSNGFIISANGDSVDAESGIDAAGGGGGGGTIILDVNSYQDQSSISVAGGSGGSVNNNFTGGQTGAQCHGPGGGGGGGAVGFTSAIVPPNAFNSIEGGLPGQTVNPQSACFGDSYGAESGADGAVLTSFSIAEGAISPIATVQVEGTSNLCAGTCAPILLSGAATAAWSPSQGLSETDSFDPTACPENTTTYIVTGTTLIDACAFSASFTINIIQPVEVQTDVSICEGDSIFLAGSFQSSAGLYTDSLTSQAGCDSLLTTDLLVNPFVEVAQNLFICARDSLLLEGSFQTISGQYTDTVFSDLGCDSIILTTLTVNSAIQAEQNVSICEGDSIFLEGAFRSFPGQYTDSLTSTLGCDSVQITNLEINALPTISVADATILPCESTQLIPSGGQTYVWSLDSTLSCTDCSDPIASPTETTVYVVTGTVANCFGTDSVIVSIADYDALSSVELPNVFTPNGDGLNDEFQIILDECLEFSHIDIYNRWGQLLFESQDALDFWDGKAPSDEEAIDGLYFYVLYFRVLDNLGNSEQALSGTVTILR